MCFKNRRIFIENPRNSSTALTEVKINGGSILIVNILAHELIIIMDTKVIGSNTLFIDVPFLIGARANEIFVVDSMFIVVETEEIGPETSIHFSA